MDKVPVFLITIVAALSAIALLLCANKENEHEEDAGNLYLALVSRFFRYAFTVIAGAMAALAIAGALVLIFGE